MDKHECIYKWIYDCLILTNSSVFYHDSVRLEVKPLYAAIIKVAKCEYLQFFMYYGSLEDVGKLKRAKFPHCFW